LLQQLIHNGIVVPNPPPYRGLALQVRGQTIQLTPKQEEMALAWASKQGTPYVLDPVFARNFLLDFSRALGFDEPLRLDEVDFGPAIRVVEAQRQAKADLSPEEKKAQAAIRKGIRAELKDRYGYAIANGQRVDLGNYLAEPSSIFMGRGEHPLRGRWKEGATQSDITLNLSPDAPRPAGEWAEVVWQSESLWVARWVDKLSAKLKYVWLSDTAPIKQRRETDKFDKAIALRDTLDRVRQHIVAGLQDADPRRRMIAMACYLIDVLCLRVGDEKDADEADTVGATTLRPEHVTLHADGTAEFRFLGKDSVLWHKEIELPPLVQVTLAELIRTARPPASSGNGNGREAHPTRDLPQLFPDIGSRNVNAFLSRIHPGLSAKVFRTHHATQAVLQSLEDADVDVGDPEFVKWRAVVAANREAAVLCNHTRKEGGNWDERKARFQERLDKARQRQAKCQAQLQEAREALNALRVEASAEAARNAARRSVEALPESAQSHPDRLQDSLKKEKARYTKVKARLDRRIALARERVEAARESLRKAELAAGKIQAQMEMASQTRTWNLGTSLKSYIDPRVYVQWGQQVDYDVIDRYYPTALRSKFAWARDEQPLPQEADPEGAP
jgi:DNA topoisomerase-1